MNGATIFLKILQQNNRILGNGGPSKIGLQQSYEGTPILPKRDSESIVFNSLQKMALRAFYLVTC